MAKQAAVTRTIAVWTSKRRTPFSYIHRRKKSSGAQQARGDSFLRGSALVGFRNAESMALPSVKYALKLVQPVMSCSEISLEETATPFLRPGVPWRAGKC
jgi:hypothetical protein